MGVLIFLFFIIVIAILIVKYVQSEREDYTETYEEDKPFKVKPLVETAKSMPARYAAIYEYNFRKSARICRCCDGEVPMGTTRCEICGEEIYM